jgi:simple sugar transport system substrate-binding protein
MFIKRRLGTLVVLLVLSAIVMTACAGVSSKKEFVFGVVLVGPYNDHGWSEANYSAGQYVEAQLPGTKMIYLDKLNSADRKGTTLEQVVEDMVSQGAQMIFTTSDDFAADTDVVAAKYPKVPFVHISGDHALTGKAPKNVANYMARMEYTKAIAGCAAALKTETKKVGYLGPLINDETRRLASAAYLGCRYCYEKYRGGNPDDIKFVVNWIGFWFNIPGVTLDPTQVSNDMFNSGVDVLLSGIDTTEAIVVAGQRADKGDKVWAIPYDFVGACDVKPGICLGVPYFNWGPAYVRYVKAVRDGKFKQGWEWEAPGWKDINDHDTSPVGFQFGSALSDQDKKNLEEYISQLATKKAEVFAGPLNLQDGTAYLKAGEVASDQQIWYLPQLLQGMEGASR